MVSFSHCELSIDMQQHSGSVASLLAATLDQGNHDKNNKL
jgi:hypothetical protein